MAKVVKTPHLPQICPVCKNKESFYFFKAFTNLILKLTFVRFLLKWAIPSKANFWVMLLLSIANSIVVAIFHISAQCSKCDQKSFFKTFSQDSKSEQKLIILFVFNPV